MSATHDTAPVSPTRCRPQHLDRERLRGVLSSAQFADVLYQEAVVAAWSSTPQSFQLLALAADCIYLFPLTSSQQSATTTRIAFEHVIAVDVASPMLSGQRGMMLDQSSLLFHIVARDVPKAKASSSPPSPSSKMQPKSPMKLSTAVGTDADSKVSEYFVSTFEPDSRVFFYVSRAFKTYFQTVILLPPAARRQRQHVSEDLSELLDSLIGELVAEPDHLKKSVLLNELAVAGTCNRRLQSLFFANRSRLISTSAVNESVQRESDDIDEGSSCVIGLPVLLVHDLVALLVTDSGISKRTCGAACHGIGTLEYIASALNVLVRMCFRGDLLSERLHFFLETPIDDLVAIIVSPVRRCRHRRHDQSNATREDGSDSEEDEVATAAMVLAVEEILDAQVALALELEALQQEANLVDGSRLSHRQSTHVSQLILRSHLFPTWVGKLFKRICRSVVRAEVELELLHTRRSRGSHWSLVLWRNARLLDMLWNAPCANVDVLSALRETHIDYINLYLRNPRTLEMLCSSDGDGHIREIAEFLQRFLDAVIEGS